MFTRIRLLIHVLKIMDLAVTSYESSDQVILVEDLVVPHKAFIPGGTEFSKQNLLYKKKQIALIMMGVEAVELALTAAIVLATGVGAG